MVNSADFPVGISLLLIVLISAHIKPNKTSNPTGNQPSTHERSCPQCSSAAHVRPCLIRPPARPPPAAQRRAARAFVSCVPHHRPSPHRPLPSLHKPYPARPATCTATALPSRAAGPLSSYSVPCSLGQASFVLSCRSRTKRRSGTPRSRVATGLRNVGRGGGRCPASERRG
jgi:hypothetical protein